MIVVTISMWPLGNKAKAYPLGEVRIANVGGTNARGNYSAELTRRDGRGVWRTASVSNFPRKRLGAYDLLLWVLAVAIGDRSKPKTAPRKPPEKREPEQYGRSDLVDSLPEHRAIQAIERERLRKAQPQ